MFINKLNQLFKPSRILYYVDASPEEILAFYNGQIPQNINQFSNAFGTYDYPGIFFVDGLEKEVIGIEYRADDPRIEYPEGLKSISLPASFFYSLEIDDDIEINYPFIQKLFAEVAKEDNAHRPYSDLCIKEDAAVIPSHENVFFLIERGCAERSPVFWTASVLFLLQMTNEFCAERNDIINGCHNRKSDLGETDIQRKESSTFSAGESSFG